MMRSVLLSVFLFVATIGKAAISSPEECKAAIAKDPQLAREEAALWARSNGGIEARICEAAALDALGATAMAARLLTGLAENTHRAMPHALRLTLLEDATRLWLESGNPDLAKATFANLEKLAAPSPERYKLAAQIAAAQSDWPAAQEALAKARELGAVDAETLALHARALRKTGEIEGARQVVSDALRTDPNNPQALFEAGILASATDEPEKARAFWLRIGECCAQHPLAPRALRELSSLPRDPAD